MRQHDGESDTAIVRITSDKVTKLNALDQSVKANKEAVCTPFPPSLASPLTPRGAAGHCQAA